LVGRLDPDADVLKAEIRHLREQPGDELLDRGGPFCARVHPRQFNDAVVGEFRL
jgi:hypothetical protein